MRDERSSRIGHRPCSVSGSPKSRQLVGDTGLYGLEHMGLLGDKVEFLL